MLKLFMTKERQYTAAILVIGDEILSGRTQDTNSNYISKELENIGVEVTECRIIQDKKLEIIKAINELRKKNDHVFTTGGIGPTHDDVTVESISEALGVKIEKNQEAYRILKSHYKNIDSSFNEARQRMARIPKGAKLIKNKISAAPGFKIENVFVFAGIPKVMKAMFSESLQFITEGMRIHSSSLSINSVEGEIVNILEETLYTVRDLKIGSYPYFNSKKDFGVNIVIKSYNTESVIYAEQKIIESLDKLNISYEVNNRT